MATLRIQGRASDGSIEMGSEVFGFDEAIALIEGTGRKGFLAFVGAGYRLMEDIIGDAKEIVPVDRGPLRASGHVEQPKIDGDQFQIDAGFGGASAPYALIQHEDLTLRHKEGQQAKYLEVGARRRFATADERIAREIRAEVF